MTVDLLGLEDTLTREEKSVRDAVRQLCSSVVDPHVAAWFDAGEITDSRRLMRELGKLGLLGMQLEGYGCAGMSAVDHGLACLELEASDSGVRSLVTVQGSLAMFAIWRYGTEEQKRDWLPRMATGEVIGCFALTEPDHGSDLGAMTTTARRRAGGWDIDGRKRWVTNGSISDIAVVWAQTDEGIRGFVVPTDNPGLSAPAIRRTLSLRTAVTSDLVLDGVRLPADAVLPAVRGSAGPLACLDEARYGVTWGVMGAARSALVAALGHVAQHAECGRSLSSLQLVQAKLTEMAVEVGTGCLLALHLGRRKDVCGLSPEQVSVGKLANVNKALAVCRSARRLLGTSGACQGSAVVRHVNNLESVHTDEGTAEMHTLVIGQALTGRSAVR